MRIAYLDESGVPEVGAGTSHFVLLALTIDGKTWRAKDDDISRIKREHHLDGIEFHTAWMYRRYAEQEKIADFALRDHQQRKAAATREREGMLIRRATPTRTRKSKGDEEELQKD